MLSAIGTNHMLVFQEPTVHGTNQLMSTHRLQFVYLYTTEAGVKIKIRFVSYLAVLSWIDEDSLLGELQSWKRPGLERFAYHIVKFV